MSPSRIDDPENPEWIEADFAQAKPPGALPDHVLAAFPKTPGSAAARRRLAVSFSAGLAIVGQGAGARLNSLAA